MERQAPPFFKTGPAPVLRLIFFVVLSVLMLVIDTRFRLLEVVRQAIAFPIDPLQRLASVPSVVIGRISDFFVSHYTLEKENSELKRQQLQNAEKLLQQQQLLTENNYLRQLLGLQERLPPSSITAEVLYEARDPFTRKVIINKGFQHGTQTGQVVVDDVGVVGQVTRVSPFLSEVTLIVDKDQAVPVQVVRNGLRAIAFGGGEGGTLDLRFLANNADIENGDTLVTSGIDDVYLPGLPVATVTRVERNAAYTFAKISCLPSAGVEKHGQVLVLTNERKRMENPFSNEDQPLKSKKGKKGRSSRERP